MADYDLPDDPASPGTAVEMELAFGWVCSTPESSGPFVIGPFTDEAEAQAWSTGISDRLAERLTIHGGTLIFYPDSYTQVSAAMREHGADPGELRWQDRPGR